MHEYELKVLSYIKNSSSNPEIISKGTGLNADAVQWALENLLSKNAISVKRGERIEIYVNPEGISNSIEFPEEKLIKELKSKHSAPLSAVDNRIGIIWATKNGWIKLDNGKVSITESGSRQAGLPYTQRSVLALILNAQKEPDTIKYKKLDEIYRSERETIGTLEKRKLISLKKKSFIIEVSITDTGLALIESESAAPNGGIGQLSREIIKSGSWKEASFKPYDITAKVEPIYPARMHPVHEFIDILRRIWISQGFRETTGPIIESSFWNFDALFSPQDHPTREMQDTFFLSNPDRLPEDNEALVKRVSLMHKKAWKNAWSRIVAEQALLRTQTTSVSAHNIYNYGAIDPDAYPLKLFSIGKVFRNESIDYKHLAELHQYDGIIIGKKLSVSHLKRTLMDFYDVLGFKVQIKPSYFPFVEPGLEVNYYDEEHGDWIELCGGGIIRSEITKSLGSKMSVLAWGGGLDRLMFKFIKLNSLTELYKNNIGWLRSRANIMI